MPALICLVAHPDDETILTGGLLALLASRGVGVHVVCATRGEGGEVGEPPVCERAHLGEVREAEMVCAVGKLGGQSLTFLGYVDPEVAPDGTLAAPEVDLTLLVGQLAASLRQIKPDVVLTHGTNGEYGHPAHKLMHSAAQVAVQSLGANAPLLYSFAAGFPEHPRLRLANADDPAHFVVDVSRYLDQKEAAARCHQTQNALFVRRASQAAGRKLTVREVLMTVEAVRRHWPPVDGTPDDAMARWLSSALANVGN